MPSPRLQHILVPALAAAALLPLTAMLAFTGWTDAKARAELARQYQRQSVEQAARAVEAQFTGAARMLARLAFLAPHPFEAVLEPLAAVQVHFTQLAELAPERVERRWPVGAAEPQADARLLALAAPFFARGEAGHSGFVTDPFSGRTTVLFAQPRGSRLLVGLLDTEPFLALTRTHGVVIRDPTGAVLGTRGEVARLRGPRPPRGMEHRLAEGWVIAALSPWQVEAGTSPAAAAGLGLLALGLAAALGLALARRIARPLEELTALLEDRPGHGPRLSAAPGRALPAELQSLWGAVFRLTRELSRAIAERDKRIAELNRKLDEAKRNLGEANARLAARDFVDDLTRLANRRGLEKRLSALERASPDTYLPLQVLLFRLENHDRIRARHGPQAADRVLARMAAILDRESRPDDFVVRYGVSDFLLLMRRCPGDTARQRAEAIRAALLAAGPKLGGHSIPLEVSVGIAQSESRLSRPSFADLLMAANEALKTCRPATPAEDRP